MVPQAMFDFEKFENLGWIGCTVKETKGHYRYLLNTHQVRHLAARQNTCIQHRPAVVSACAVVIAAGTTTANKHIYVEKIPPPG